MDKIDRKDIDEALKNVRFINPKQREYLKGVLLEHRDFGGMSKFEFERSLRKLKEDHGDNISRFELRKVEEELRSLYDSGDNEET
ncbi:MAG TPA: hypothetical protein VD998_00905 [Verrucomicrobiae bacterium]|nr:hypothetical protein [Verrucomicrobiae bacterium]